MTNLTTYAPILKWKQGEREALKNLKSSNEGILIPVIQIIDEVVPSKFFEELKKCFNGSVYLCTYHAGDDSRQQLKGLIEYANKNSINAWPYLLSDEPDEILSELISISSRVGISTPIPGNFDGLSVNQVLDIFSKHTQNCKIDLFLDADEVLDRRIANMVFSEIMQVFNNNLAQQFNSIIICVTSLPKRITLESGANDEFMRWDYRIFEEVMKRISRTALGSKLAYSDYGVTAFTDSEIDFKLLQHGVLPKVKYTIADKYLVFKGKKDRVSNTYSRSYNDIAREIVNSQYFYGKDFSFGDSMIEQKATSPKPGNAANWVTYCTSHHIAVVMEQLSK